MLMAELEASLEYYKPLLKRIANSVPLDKYIGIVNSRVLARCNIYRDYYMHSNSIDKTSMLKVTGICPFNSRSYK